MSFHPVILAGGRGSRMYPLTEDCPKALLPVGNKPLIWYPVQLLERNGFEEALVIVRESQQRVISDVLTSFQTSHGVHLRFTLSAVPDQEDLGTADALRLARNKIKADDVLVISCDLVTSVQLHLLTDHHSTHGSTLTTLLVRPPDQTEETRKKGAIVSERDIIGLADESRLVYFSAEADLDEHLEVSRSMLRRYPHIRVCSQLLDAHLYILKRWVLDYLAHNKTISSVKGELVPHLVRHQSVQRGTSYTSANKEALKSAAESSLNKMEELAYTMSSFAGLGREGESQLVSCHALVVQDKLCTRINNVPAYMDINRMLPNYLNEFHLAKPTAATPTRVKGVSSDSMVESGVQLGDKGSVKRSCIGQHCSIGAKTKILNCIIMDHVHIGEGCSLQGCIVCSHARIEDKVTLKDCQVGANFTVTREADLRGETLVMGGGMLF